MVIGIIGENCSGKSTLAEKIGAELGAEIISGNDYLRMAKSESEARKLFREKLKDAVSGDNIIYVISEPVQLASLPDGAIRILVKADLETIKERFRTRMHGNLPDPVAKMLERKHGMFDEDTYDYCFDSTKDNATELCEALKKRT
jgi:adenylate kinase family enzyme